MAISTFERDARSIVIEQKAIEEKCARAVSRTAGAIRAQVMHQVRSWRGPRIVGNVDVFNLMRKKLHTPLVDCLLVGHLLGVRTTRLFFAAAKQQLGLAQFGDSYKNTSLKGALKILERQTQGEVNIDALQAQYSTYALKVIRTVSEDTDLAVKDTISNLLAEGHTLADAKDQLRTKFADLGLTPDSDFTLETIFRTQLQISTNAGKWQAEQDPDIQEILWGYKYVTVDDSRVRAEHAAMEGVTDVKDSAIWDAWYPPNGYNCRCQLIPIFEERAIKSPPDQDIDGNDVVPDKGFEHNFGDIFATAS